MSLFRYTPLLTPSTSQRSPARQTSRPRGERPCPFRATSPQPRPATPTSHPNPPTPDRHHPHQTPQSRHITHANPITTVAPRTTTVVPLTDRPAPAAIESRERGHNLADAVDSAPPEQGVQRLSSARGTGVSPVPIFFLSPFLARKGLGDGRNVRLVTRRNAPSYRRTRMRPTQSPPSTN
jgi:hypothetical protein